MAHVVQAFTPAGLRLKPLTVPRRLCIPILLASMSTILQRLGPTKQATLAPTTLDP